MPATSRKDPKSHRVESEAIEVKIVVDNASAPDRIYANHVQITNTPFDFTIDFCDLGPFAGAHEVTEEKGLKQIKVKSRIRIVVSEPVVEGMIRAFQDNLERFRTRKAEE